MNAKKCMDDLIAKAESHFLGNKVLVSLSPDDVNMLILEVFGLPNGCRRDFISEIISWEGEILGEESDFIIQPVLYNMNETLKFFPQYLPKESK
jgi:hypothetical protein